LKAEQDVEGWRNLGDGKNGRRNKEKGKRKGKEEVKEKEEKR